MKLGFKLKAFCRKGHTIIGPLLDRGPLIACRIWDFISFVHLLSPIIYTVKYGALLNKN